MKRILVIVLMVAVALSSAGCRPRLDPNVEIVFVVDIVWVYNEYARTGDPGLDAIIYIPNQTMFAYPGQQYLTLLDVRLRETPLGIERMHTMIDDRIQFNSVTVRDGTAYVDMVGEGLSGSSLEEGLLISQIVSALTGSFDEVERVRFLVDGESAETLMGHIDIETPFYEGLYPIGPQ